MSNAIRLTMLLSTVMDLETTLADDPAVEMTSRDGLRSMLLRTADDLDWFGTVAGTVTGRATWPADAQDRLARLRNAASGWDTAVAPPPELLDAARESFGLLHPAAATP
jgi:hypothetical protein